MFGKGALLMVLGFSLLFLVFGSNFNNLTSSSFNNLNNFYVNNKAHQLAVTGANMAANEIFMNNLWDAGYDDLSFDGGKIHVYVSNPLVGINGKVAICHKPPGNPDNKHTIYVSSSAVGAHLAHGDHLGDCAANPGDKNIITILAEGTYGDVTKEVIILLQPSKFSKFAYFSIIETTDPKYPIYWTKDDTVWGPLHINSDLYASEHPVFYGKVTCKNKIKYQNKESTDYPQFNGGFEKGVDLEMPIDGVSNLELAADDSGVKFTGQDTVYLTFDADSIKVRFHKNDKDSVYDASTYSPNGVIFADDAVLRIKGDVSGRFSIGCSGNGNQYGGKGNIYIDDHITYNDDPRINKNSQDMLGIIAEQNCYIADNTANSSGDIDIHGSIYCQKGGFGSENYKTRSYAGNINLHGGIIQAIRRAVGTFGGWKDTGFDKRYRYDERLMLVSPPHYPGTGQYEVVSWYE